MNLKINKCSPESKSEIIFAFLRIVSGTVMLVKGFAFF